MSWEGATLLPILLLACGPEPLRVVNQSSESWTQEPGFDDEVIAAADRAARDWGADLSVLDGWQIIIVDGIVDCGDGLRHTGCTRFRTRHIDVSTYFALPEDRGGGCVEVLPIWHEVGHVVLAPSGADPEHTDPRWINEPLPVCPQWFATSTR